ncbi:putative beta-glucosidase J, partial [Symbiodinium microadriaticum]
MASSPEGSELAAAGGPSDEEAALINEQAADDLLQQLTLEEKVGMVSGVNMWESGGVPRLGLQNLRFSDGALVGTG